MSQTFIVGSSIAVFIFLVFIVTVLIILGVGVGVIIFAINKAAKSNSSQNDTKKQE